LLPLLFYLHVKPQQRQVARLAAVVLAAVVLPDRNDRVLTGRGGIATIKVLMRAEIFREPRRRFHKGVGRVQHR